MTGQHDYDVAVIGSGPAGYVAGIRASQLGARTCVIEKGPLGGVCTNVGCIPTKVLWESARMALRLERAEEFGFRVENPRPDWAVVGKRRDSIVRTLRGGIDSLLSGNDVELLRGEAAFLDSHTLQVAEEDETRRISAEKIMIATGSKPVELPELPFDHEAIIDSSDAVSADELPDSVIVIGGGYIGLEFGCIYSANGVELHIVEALDRLLPAVDADCAREVAKTVKKRGAGIHTGVTAEEVETTGDGVQAKLSDGTELSAEKMLVCVGRRPDCEGLRIEEAGLEPDESGAVAVNSHLQTEQPHIYAIGDVNGRAMLAHVGSHEAMVAAAHATGSLSAEMDYRVVPACVFVQPEIATVGLTEEEADKEFDDLIVKKFPFRALGKAHVLGETEGMVKMVCDAETGEVLGVHMAGPHASVMLGEAALALGMECTAQEIAETIHTHPTLPEALKEAAEGAAGMPINWRG